MSTRIPPGKLSRGKGAGVGSGRMTGNASVTGWEARPVCGRGWEARPVGKAHFPSTGPQRVKARSPGSGGRLGSLGAVESGGVDESGRGEKQGPDASATRQQGDGPDPRSLKGSRAGAASWPKPLLETRLRQQGGGQPECEQAGSGAAENPPPAPADAGWVPATPSGLRILRRTLKHSVSTDGNTASNGQERG